jgi:formiminotetrahydrofolate cyclodeaminase
MKLVDRSLREVLEAFQAATPTPGGGSASALAAAVGSSLLAMAASLPKHRATSEADVARLRAAAAQCRAYAEALAGAVDGDSEAYERVIAAYRLPRATDAEKTARTARIQDGLRQAVAVPLDVMRRCAGSAVLAETVAALANRNAASDVAVALELLGAGLRGARLNVDINLGGITDGAYAEGAANEAARLGREYDAAAAAASARLHGPS